MGKLKQFLRKYEKIIVTVSIILVLSVFVAWYLSSLFYFVSAAGVVEANPLMWFRKYYRIYGYPDSFKWYFLGSLLVFFYCFLRNYKNTIGLDAERNFKYSKSGVYGTAELLKEKDMLDVAQAQPMDIATGTILGQLDRTGTRVINTLPNTRINKHNCIFGASQSGKTFCFVLPYALQVARRRESLVVTDPKGELYETTSEYFRSLGYIVRRFDLKKPRLSDGWDCLQEVLNSKDTPPQDRAAIFSDIVIQNTSANAGGGGIYEDGPQALLKALLLRVALDPSYKAEGTQNIATCVHMIKNPRGAEYIDGEVFNPETVPAEAAGCLTSYNSFKQASQNLYGNLVTGLATRLEVFDSQTVCDVMSQNDIDLRLPGQRPCVYYCIMSDMHETYNFLGALFFSFLFLDLVEYADSLPERKCKVPVNFLLDEFANIGSIPDFDKKIAVIRSRALNVSIILQDINQLRNRYPKTWSSIMSNCATHLCIGFNDLETQEYYEKRTGQATVQVQTNQHAASEPLLQVGHKHSTGDGKRSVLSSDELCRLDKDECLICWQYHNSMKAYKYPVNIHPEYNRLKRCKYADYPPIDDTMARQKLREDEMAHVEAFEAWLAQGGNPFPDLKTGEKSNIAECKENLIEKIRSAKEAIILRGKEPEEEVIDLDAYDTSVKGSQESSNVPDLNEDANETYCLDMTESTSFEELDED